MVSGVEVAPAHVGHAGAEDGDVGRAHAGTPVRTRRSLAGERGAQQAEVLDGGRPGHHHDDVAGPGVRVAAQARRRRSRASPATRWRWKALGGSR